MDFVISSYCEQHDRALQCAEKISAILGSPEKLKADAQGVRILLAQLSGILLPHLRAEDRFMYPLLIESGDHQTAQIAKRYWDEIGNFTPLLMAFLDRWKRIGEIETCPEEFVSETTGLFSGLKKRIEAEEKELYPLFRDDSGFKQI